MKKFIVAVIVVCGLLIAGCSREVVPEQPVLATVAIEKLECNLIDGINIRFTPSEDASFYRYVLSEKNDVSSFENGTMEGIVEVSGSEPCEVLFENLESATVYTVFACAYDSEGNSGGVATRRVMTGDQSYTIDVQYVSDHSAGFVFNFTNDYYSTEYYLGKPEDREAFLAGSLSTSSIGELSYSSVVKNYLELDPDTEYVMYAKGYNRAGVAEYREVPVRTAVEGECPKVTIETLSSDIYKTKIQVIGNDKTGRIIALFDYLGYYDKIFDLNWHGDIVGMLCTWADLNWPHTFSSISEKLNVEMKTVELKTDMALEMHVVVCDKDMNPANVQRFSMSTPPYNPDLKGGTVAITISDVTSKGATYTYKPEEDNFAFMFDTVEADWYDELKNSDQWYEFYLSDYLFRQGYYFVYTQELESGEYVFTEKAGTPLTRYYAAACPMTGNGPNEKGWLPIVLEEYTTLAE